MRALSRTALKTKIKEDWGKYQKKSEAIKQHQMMAKLLGFSLSVSKASLILKLKMPRAVLINYANKYRHSGHLWFSINSALKPSFHEQCKRKRNWAEAHVPTQKQTEEGRPRCACIGNSTHTETKQNYPNLPPFWREAIWIQCFHWPNIAKCGK